MFGDQTLGAAGQNTIGGVVPAVTWDAYLRLTMPLDPSAVRSTPHTRARVGAHTRTHTHTRTHGDVPPAPMRLELPSVLTRLSHLSGQRCCAQ